MLPFLGNTLAKSCRKGRLQCRDFSSVSEKAVSKVYRYCFTAVFGGAGFLLGGVTTSPVSKGLREYEERFVKGLQRLEKMEARRGKWISSLKEKHHFQRTSRRWVRKTIKEKSTSSRLS